MRKILSHLFAGNYPVGLFFALIASFFSTLLIVHGNLESSHFKLDLYACILILLVCAVALVLSLALFKILPKMSRVINCICNGLAFYILLTIIFFPVQRGVLDGAPAPLSLWDAGIHFAIFFGCLFLGIISIYKQKLNVMYSRAVIILGCFSLVAGAYMAKDVMVIKDNDLLQKQWQDATKLSSDGNIIVICLDMVQQDFARSYLENNTQAQIEFDGFTFFTNTASASPYTGLSLSTIVRGKIFDGKSTNAPVDDNLMSDMIKHGYDIAVSSILAGRVQSPKYKTLPESIPAGIVSRAAALLFLGVDRYSPVALTNKSHKEFGWISKTDQREAYKTFIDLLHVDPHAQKCMRWLHNLQTHYPVRFTKEGVFSFELSPDDVYGEIADAFTMTEDLLKKLKTLGVYDNSLILIISDHGFKPLPQMKTLTTEQLYLVHPVDENIKNNMVIGQYQPVIMSKPPRAKGMLNYNNNAVSLMDIRATLNEFAAPGETPMRNGVNILDYENINIKRTVPMFVFSGHKFSLDDFQSTENWQIGSLHMPMQDNYKPK